MKLDGHANINCYEEDEEEKKIFNQLNNLHETNF